MNDVDASLARRRRGGRPSADADRAGLPRQPRRRRPRVDARPASTCCAPPAATSSRRSRSRSPWRRTTASSPASTCSPDPADFPAEPDVMVTFDCGSLGRLGDLEPAAKAARELIVLDHHVSNTRYGTINVIDPTAAASGVRRAPPRRRARPPAHHRRRGRALRRARVRHRPLPVRDHHARGVRARPRAGRVRRAGVAPVARSCSRSTGSRTSSCSARRWPTPSSTSSVASCGPRSPRTCSPATASPSRRSRA